MAIFAFLSKMHQLENSDNTNNIREWLTALLNNDRPFVVYRLPDESVVRGFDVGEVERIDLTRFTPNTYSEAFLVAPFHLSNGAFILRPIGNIKSISLSGKKVDLAESEGSLLEMVGARKAYSQSFTIAHQALKSGEADKVVLARQMEVPKVSADMLPHVFETLCQLYPKAFVYFFVHPLLGRWMGASPEIFLHKDDYNFNTVALAATRSGERCDDDWNSKELEEQGFVAQFIEEKLKDFGVSQFTKDGPRPISAGQVVHLRTHYHFRSQHISNNVGPFLEVLHPTPAVGGYPKEAALEVIGRAETFDRAFYSGFLGPVQHSAFQFFVNIRCMELVNGKAVLYLGGGLTRESGEESEWEETRLKAQTLWSVINSVKQNIRNELYNLR
ncbi:chorismate-binding protein [Thermophagus xiamenensis]|uniref:Isochorismate synthase n=1 Tax=Thermophagus xiamenensis TaxID=385682 RepID=A0A1I1W0F1_9BACT|nr:chorismate-binding protein [Thermophagus xiamenensis]SFD86370.1 isochorismate synthase [Thermophagus xiamenensis]